MSSDWQRLSPLAIVYFAVRGFIQLLNTYAVLIAGVIALTQMGLGAGQVVIYLLAVLMLLVLGSSLYYLNFAYVQEPARFLIREGIFSKKRTEVPFSKIQNTTLKQPFYYRPFNLVVLNMDSAGSSNKEVALAALSREKAEAIQRSIQCFHQGVGHEPTVEDSEPSASADVERAPILTRSTFDVVLHGLAHNRAWFILAVAAPLLSRMDQPLERLFNSVGLDVAQLVEHASVIVLGGLVLLVFAGAAFLLSVFSVAGAILALYDLKLFYSNGSYHRTSGLLNRYEIQMKRSRVQTLRYHQNWLDLIASRLTMVLEPFSVAAVDNSQSMMQKILLPSVTHAQFCNIARHVYPDFDFDEVAIHRVSALYLLRGLGFAVLPAMLAAAALAAGIALWQWLAPLLAGLLVLAAVFLRWRRLGVGMHSNHVVVRSGLVGQQYFCFAAHKVQQVKFKQSLLLKRRGLATLELVLASRALQVPLIDETLAADIAGRCMEASTLSEQSWM